MIQEYWVNSSLAIGTVIELDSYLQYRKGQTNKRTDFKAAKGFLRHLEKICKEYKPLLEGHCFDLDMALWKPFEKLTGRTLRTSRDIKAVLDSYLPDFWFLANSDLELFRHAENSISPQRIEEICKFIMATTDALLPTADDHYHRALVA